MPRALQIITQQQRAMSSALLAVRTIARKALRSGSSPDFSQLVPLLDYVERFPETLHQANEEKYLLRVLEAREPRLARLVARLRRDHAVMKGYGQRLRTAVAYWRTGDPKAGRQTAIWPMITCAFAGNTPGSRSASCCPRPSNCSRTPNGRSLIRPWRRSPTRWRCQKAAGTAKSR